MNDFQILVKVDKLITQTDLDVNLRAGTEETINGEGEYIEMDWIEYSIIKDKSYYLFTAYSDVPDGEVQLTYFARSTDDNEYEEMEMTEWFADLGVSI